MASFATTTTTHIDYTPLPQDKMVVHIDQHGALHVLRNRKVPENCTLFIKNNVGTSSYNLCNMDREYVLQIVDYNIGDEYIQYEAGKAFCDLSLEKENMNGITVSNAPFIVTPESLELWKIVMEDSFELVPLFFEGETFTPTALGKELLEELKTRDLEKDYMIEKKGTSLSIPILDETEKSIAVGYAKVILLRKYLIPRIDAGFASTLMEEVKSRYPGKKISFVFSACLIAADNHKVPAVFCKIGVDFQMLVERAQGLDISEENKKWLIEALDSMIFFKEKKDQEVRQSSTTTSLQDILLKKGFKTPYLEVLLNAIHKAQRLYLTDKSFEFLKYVIERLPINKSHYYPLRALLLHIGRHYDDLLEVIPILAKFDDGKRKEETIILTEDDKSNFGWKLDEPLDTYPVSFIKMWNFQKVILFCFEPLIKELTTFILLQKAREASEDDYVNTYGEKDAPVVKEFILAKEEWGRGHMTTDSMWF